MGKINLDNVRGAKTFSVKANADTENGALVGLGGLVEGEYNLYEQTAPSEDNFYLVTTPEIDRTNKSDSIEHTNKKDVAMRVHLLESGDIFTLDTNANAGLASLEAGADVGVSADGFGAAGEGKVVAKVLEKTTIGTPARNAVALRMV